MQCEFDLSLYAGIYHKLKVIPNTQWDAIFFMQPNIKMLQQNNVWSTSAFFFLSNSYSRRCMDSFALTFVQFDLNKLCEIEVWRLGRSGH